jgi:signal peptidase I
MNKAYIVAPLVIAVAFLIFPFLLYYGNMIMVVTSDSMLPTLKPYDLIVVERVSVKEIKTGDIVVFDTHLAELGIVAHRAVEIFDDHGEIGIDTKGDNVESADPWTVHSEDLIGRVFDVVPKMGIFLIDPVRYVIVAVIVITAISLVFDIYKEQRTRQSDNPLQ